MPGELVLGTQQALALERSEPSIMEVIAAVARDPSVDVARIDALVALFERQEARDAEKLYHVAMAKMQPRLPRVKKNGSIDLGSGKAIAFARWEDVDVVLRPILSEHGFSLSFPTRIDGEKLIMQCVVSHVAGHSEKSESVVGVDSKLAQRMNSLQATGSGRSYAKRYLALDMLNIVTEGADDDANSADPISDEQAMDIQTMLDYLALEPKQLTGFWRWAAAERVSEIQRKDFERIHAELTRRVKAREGK